MKLLDAEKEKKQLLENQRKLFVEKQQKLENYHTTKNEDLISQMKCLREQLEINEKNQSAVTEEWKHRVDIITKENEKLISDVNNLKAGSSNDKQVLVSQVKKIETKLKMANAERETLIVTHQNRIQELNEHFRRKLAEAESPQKIEAALQRALNLQNEKHAQEISFLETKNRNKFEELEKELEKQWQSKLDEELTKFSEKEKKLKSILSNMQKKLESEVKRYHLVIQDDKQKHDEEVAKLEDSISSLCKELQESKMNTVDVAESLKFEMEINSLKESLSHTIDEVNEKEKKITQLKDEVQKLRECVRKECEERYQLTESLSEARTELLALQRFNSPPSTKSKGPTLNSPSLNKSSAFHSPISRTSKALTPTSHCLSHDSPPSSWKKSVTSSLHGSTDQGEKLEYIIKRNVPKTSPRKTMTNKTKDNRATGTKNKLKISLRNNAT